MAVVREVRLVADLEGRLETTRSVSCVLGGKSERA